MEEEKKGKLKAIYSELRSYLAHAPIQKDMYDTIDESVWEQYNVVVDLLSKASSQDYSRFRIEPIVSSDGYYSDITVFAYRQKLGGLISTLHGKYFAVESNPLDGVPSTLITQSQQQGQSVHIQMIRNIQSMIDEKIRNYQDGSKENVFFTKTQRFTQFYIKYNQTS